MTDIKFSSSVITTGDFKIHHEVILKQKEATELEKTFNQAPRYEDVLVRRSVDIKTSDAYVFPPVYKAGEPVTIKPGAAALFDLGSDLKSDSAYYKLSPHDKLLVDNDVAGAVSQINDINEKVKAADPLREKVASDKHKMEELQKQQPEMDAQFESLKQLINHKSAKTEVSAKRPLDIALAQTMQDTSRTV